MAQIHITDASTIALVERISLIEGKPPETIVQEAVQEKAERDGVEHPTQDWQRG